MNVLSGFADVSLPQLVLVAGVALAASIVGGSAGYGTGALMPLVLVPLIGAEPVVPIIAISSIFTNLSRFAAFVRYADRRRALIVMAAACLTTALGAYGYTLLTNAGAALVIGTMLILSVPLRRLLKRRDVKVGDTGLAVGAVGYGVVALPGAFRARAFVERMPVHIHTAILDAAVIVGGIVMITTALRH